MRAVPFSIFGFRNSEILKRDHLVGLVLASGTGLDTMHSTLPGGPGFKFTLERRGSQAQVASGQAVGRGQPVSQFTRVIGTGLIPAALSSRGAGLPACTQSVSVPGGQYFFSIFGTPLNLKGLKSSAHFHQ
jgi:hypothetical protein